MRASSQFYSSASNYALPMLELWVHLMGYVSTLVVIGCETKLSYSLSMRR